MTVATANANQQEPQPSANEIDPAAMAKVSGVEKKSKKLSLMELTERTCEWPVGDPATDDFWFCGLPAEPGKPYCEAHVGVAFQPMSARRDRRHRAYHQEDRPPDHFDCTSGSVMVMT